MSQTFELPPAAPNPPYIGGPYVGCTAATAADFIEAYTGKAVSDLNALFASMTKRHRLMDAGSTHGLRPHGGCGFCIYLELYARGLPVAYQQLTWSAIRTYLNRGQYVALAGIYSNIPMVAVNSYSSTVPARGRSDTFAGPHMMAGFGTEDAGLITLVKDPDFGNWRGTPPYSRLATSAVQAFFGSLNYPTCYATKPPGGAAPSHEAKVKTVTHLWNPITRKWAYTLKVGTVLTVGGHPTIQGGKSCYPVRGPNPYVGYFVPLANVRLTT